MSASSRGASHQVGGSTDDVIEAGQLGAASTGCSRKLVGAGFALNRLVKLEEESENGAVIMSPSGVRFPVRGVTVARKTVVVG